MFSLGKEVSNTVHYLTLHYYELKSSKLNKIQNFVLEKSEKQVTLKGSTAPQLSFEWSHLRISLMDFKVRITLCS